ncbi:MAG: PAS domain S-box protein [Spirochaetes bacterium]|nr:PAS domain S-box protein [Spirochaetota bacterium]
MTKKNVMTTLSILLMVIGVAIGISLVISILSGTITQEKNRVRMMAESAASMIPDEMIYALKGDESDLERSEYKELKKHLMKLRAMDPSMRFSYLMGYRDGGVYFIADSEPAGSEDYSPPGQLYTEASEVEIRPFREGVSIVSGPASDRWGQWISAMVPITDDLSDKTIAVLGLDYSVKAWQSKILMLVAQSLLLVISALALMGIAFSLKRQNLQISALNDTAARQQRLMNAIFNQAPAGISLMKGRRHYPMVNDTYLKILGRSREDLLTMDWTEITYKDDLEADAEKYGRLERGEIEGYDLEKRFLRGDGSTVWTDMSIRTLKFEGSKDDPTHVCILRDISERKKFELDLAESERSKSVFLDQLPGIAYRCVRGQRWRMEFVSQGCKFLTGYTSSEIVDGKAVSIEKIIRPEYQHELWKKVARALCDRTSVNHEFEITTADGGRKWVLLYGKGIYGIGGRAEALEGIVIDISDKKRQEAEKLYISDHDSLTGLYNRRYFNDAMARFDASGAFPGSLIVGNINGIRLINNAFSHASGDRLIVEAGRILSLTCSGADLLVRTGGDEFCLLMPGTDAKTLKAKIEAIQLAIGNYNKENQEPERNLSLSLGYSTAVDGDAGYFPAFKDALEKMREGKILEHKSNSNAILKSVLATLYERSEETEKHAERLSTITTKIGKLAGLSEPELNELRLFSVLHDIGKVGVEDRILKKTGPLTEEEWVGMKSHSEIGYRIAMSSPDFRQVAPCILSHHERWDGNGYPHGLKGAAIPLYSRILAIADTYDAMTMPRIYRPPLGKVKAKEEIARNAGTQFDPELVGFFMECVDFL